MGGVKKYSDHVIAEAVSRNAGVFSAAARDLGCNVSTVKRWRGRTVGAVDWVERLREQGVQLASRGILRALQRGSESACFKYMRLFQGGGWHYASNPDVYTPVTPEPEWTPNSGLLEVLAREPMTREEFEREAPRIREEWALRSRN